MKLHEVFAIALLTCGAAVASTPVAASFEEPRSYGIGSAQALAVADFNGDGAPDAATVGTSVTVFLNNGNGYFTQAQSIGLSGFAVVSADFNGDGFADLAVGTTNGFIVLLGNGNGTFQAPTLYPGTFASLATGDFNGDGIADIAAFGTQVQVFFGSTSGTLQTGPVSPGTCSQPNSTLSADLNGDGKADLVAGCDSVGVMLGNGDGSFAKAVQYNVPAAALAIGDFNGDGMPDIASVENTSVYILLNNGEGGFTTGASMHVRQTLNSIVAGDWNGDGNTDVLAGGEGVGVLLAGRGDGSFSKGQEFVLAYGSQALAVADFNGDGIPDVASANTFPYNNLPAMTPFFSVMIGAGHGKFQSSRAFDVGAAPGSIAVGDFNGDGKPDLAVANYSTQLAHSSPNPSNIAVLLGAGAGRLSTPVDYAADKPTAIAVGDMNGDGKLDIAFVGDETVGTLPGNGDGTFGAAIDTPCPNCTGGTLVVADFNGDGIPDLATRGDGVSVLLGKGDGTFKPAIASGTLYPTALSVADFNNDGIPDLLTTDGDEVYILPGKGNGKFGEPVLVANSAGLAVTADFNGDGNADIAVAMANGGGVAIYLGNGDDTFTPAFWLDVQANGQQMLVGDFNGDGIPDLICPLLLNYGYAAVLLGIGNGNFDIEAKTLLIDGGPNPVQSISPLLASGNFNGDGMLDIASIGEGYNVWILLNSTGH